MQRTELRETKEEKESEVLKMKLEEKDKKKIMKRK